MKTCNECGSTSRVHFNKEHKMNLCDTCRKIFRENPIKYIPPIGEIHYDVEGKVICHVCGRSFNGLSQHITSRHNLTPSQYKERYQLNRGQSLTSNKTNKNLRENALENGIENLIKYRKTFEKGHTVTKGKPRRLQTLKNRNGLKYKVNKYE